MRSALSGVSRLVLFTSLRVLGIGAAFAMIGPDVAAASTPEQNDLPQLLEQADLVFEGTVLSIDYKNSEVVEPGDAKLPHTFVTFEIHDLIKGRSSAGALVTLRFLGGPDGTGRVLEVTELPRFSLGERDVLFVRNEKSAICPVVGAEGGRFRVVRGDVYQTDGSEVWIAPDGTLLAGEPKIDVDAPNYPPRTEVKDADAALESADAAPNAPPEGSVRPDAEGFKHLLKLEAAARQAAAGSAVVTEFKSAKLGDVLRFPRLRAVAPRGPAKNAPSSKAKPASPEAVDRHADPDRPDSKDGSR